MTHVAPSYVAPAPATRAQGPHPDPAPQPPDAHAASVTRILVHPCAGASDAAVAALVRRAVRIARRAGARLTFADVLPEVPALVQRLLPEGVHVPELLREERRRRLDALARHARRAKVAVELVLLEGSPAVALVREVLRDGHDLLMLPTGAAAVGALGVQLVRKAPCPVLLIPAPADGAGARRRPRILAAIDVSDAPPAGDAPDVASPRTPAQTAGAALARRILDAAAALAALEGGELHVLHAWTAYGEGMLRGRAFGGISAADVQRYVDGMEAHAATALGAAVAHLHRVLTPERVHLVKGEPGDVIPALVRAASADTLVVGTVARSGLAGLLVGNTAERLVEAPPCDVLVVKPAGFSTTVRPDDELARGQTMRPAARAVPVLVASLAT